VASFDGVPLDVDLTLPARSVPDGGYPLLVMKLGVTVVPAIDAEINARLWDIGPDSTATLVTRGAFRWTAGSTIAYALQGNGWVFQSGHSLRIQVTQNDAPYLRLDNYASVINYSFMQLTLPTTA
jgi:predicted acyl esterase